LRHALYHLSWYGAYWLGWVLFGFLPYELYWAWKNPDYTLSDQFRALEGITQANRYHPLECSSYGSGVISCSTYGGNQKVVSRRNDVSDSRYPDER
jgi:hypothetical protein